jgi:uncharacterized protein YcfL
VKISVLFTIAFICIVALSACAEGETIRVISTPHETTNPAPLTIKNITTSSKVLAKSDCIPTSVTISADISSPSAIKLVTLWYRIGQDQVYTSQPMLLEKGNIYSARVVALDIPGGEYGPLEFYIVANDVRGGEAMSTLDTSVELLPCVAN